MTTSRCNSVTLDTGIARAGFLSEGKEYGVETQSQTRMRYFILIFFLALSLSIRWWLLDTRWINPDEGAHLMDAFLFLQGKIPGVDFMSRQPLYVFANALTLKLFGISLLGGRILPMTVSLMTTVAVYSIGAKLFNKRAAVIAAVVYLMLPLEILNSVVVKTEPLTNLLICSSIVFLLLYHERRNASWIFLSGVFAALTFYVRQSAIILPALTVLSFFLHTSGNRTKSLLDFGIYIAGYFVIVASFFAYYSPYFSVGGYLSNSLSPTGFLADAFRKIGAKIAGYPHPGIIGGFNSADDVGPKTWGPYYYLRAAFLFHLFFFIALAWSFFKSAFSWFQDGYQSTRIRRSHQFLCGWFVLLAVGYLYQYITHSFFIDYFREFLPILSIMFAAYLWEIVFFSMSSQRHLYTVGVSAIILILIYVCESFFFRIPNKFQIIAITGAISAVMLFQSGRDHQVLKKIGSGVIALTAGYLIFSLSNAPHTTYAAIAAGIGIGTLSLIWIPNRFRFINFVFIALSLSLSTSIVARTLDVRYDSIWSPKALHGIADSIRQNTLPEDEIMSGAVIWEFESQRPPFLTISHPLAYRNKMPDFVRDDIRSAMNASPPRIIVADGYMEQIYMKHIPRIEQDLNEKYDIITISDKARAPVRVYLLK